MLTPLKPMSVLASCMKKGENPLLQGLHSFPTQNPYGHKDEFYYFYFIYLFLKNVFIN